MGNDVGHLPLVTRAWPQPIRWSDSNSRSRVCVDYPGQIVHRLEAPVMVCTAQTCRRLSRFYSSSCQAQKQKFSEPLVFYV